MMSPQARAVEARREWAKTLRAVADGSLSVDEALANVPVLPNDAEVPSAWGSAVHKLEQERDHGIREIDESMSDWFAQELRKLASRIDSDG